MKYRDGPMKLTKVKTHNIKIVMTRDQPAGLWLRQISCYDKGSTSRTVAEAKKLSTARLLMPNVISSTNIILDRNIFVHLLLPQI